MRKTAAVAAALSLMAAPAFAQEAQPDRGKSTAPGQICKGESKKKTNRGKGKSAFAACVSGVKKANAQSERNEQRAAKGQKSLSVSPGRLCRTESRKKSSSDKKSPFAACVKGATEANKRNREAARSGASA